MTVNINYSEILGFAEASRQASVYFNEELEQAGKDIVDWLHDDTTAVPDRPAYPIQWDSEAQRRAFFATNGFGKGIPTRRTYNLQNQQQQTITVSGGLLSAFISLLAPEAKWTMSARYQSNIFIGTYKTVEEIWLNRKNQIMQRLAQVPIRAFARARSK